MTTKKTESASDPSRLLPGRDIFRTPENEAFYSANIYQSLDANRREIRLIELSTYTGGGILDCKLLPATLLTDAQKRYYALSYCAGDPTATKTISVNGVRCNIFANLHRALVLARRYWNRSSRQGPILLWVDQLCINQHDLKERSHQVGFMREIYHRAECTLACLSTSKARGRGMEWFIDLCHAVPSQKDDEPFQDDTEDESEVEDEAQAQAARREKRMASRRNLSPEKFRYHRMCHYLWNNMHDQKFVNGWIAFYEVLSSPWWNRAWVCQEFLVSDQISFMFGEHLVSWEVCWEILQAFCGLHRYLLTNRSLFLEKKGLAEGSTEDRLFCRILTTVQRRDLHRQVDHVRFAAKMKIQWRGSMGIKALLSHSRSCKSSDDRDRVYAILGLASPGYHILPDYSPEMTATQVMTMTTRAIIDKEDSLGILIHATVLVNAKNPALPSWVVDWTSAEVSNIRNYYFGKRLFHQGFCNIPRESAEASFEIVTDPIRQTRACIAKVYGISITKIQLTGQAWPFAHFENADGWKGSAMISVNDGDEVWILYGLRVPIALRPYRDGYQVISCASLLGKDGEGFSKPIISTKTGRVNRRRIALY
ncbi:hypothetical protein FOXYSP1_19814 [Fusarium oxysporum f. sp. phaseoli]